MPSTNIFFFQITYNTTIIFNTDIFWRFCKLLNIFKVGKTYEFLYLCKVCISDCHLHLDAGVVRVVDQLEIFELELVDVRYVRVDLEIREGVWVPLQLLLQGFNMVRVHMRIAQSVDELTPLQATDLSEHAGQ